MKITLGFLLLALTSYTEGKSIKQELTSSQTNKEVLRLKRSVFDIIPKRRMEKILNGKFIKTFDEKFLMIIKQIQKARLMKMQIKKQVQKQKRNIRSLCSIMADSLNICVTK